jgi:superfamily II DNA or RNA helicase
MAGKMFKFPETKLRDYQGETVRQAREFFRQGKKKLVIMLATAAGKTVISTHMIKQAAAKGLRCGFVCDRIELINQTSARLDMEGVSHGVIQGDHPRYDPAEQVQVCSIQTLARRKTKQFDLIIVDEVQTFHAAHKRLLMENDGSFIIGLSATPFTKGLGKHFDGLISPVTAKQLIEQGHLVDFKVYGPKTIDVSGVKTIAGDYDQKELGERADKPKIVADIVKTWMEKGGNRQTICFATNVAHSKHIVREFCKAGVMAEHIDSFTDKETRAAILKRLANFETRIVSCVDILTKGFDCPVVSCIIQALPTKSLMRHIQQIGRGLRTSQGKIDCCVLDHSGNHERLGFIDDIEFTELDDGKKKEASSKKAKEKPEKLPLVCPSCDYMKPAGVRKCPACGLIAEHIADVETEEGELREVKRNRKGYTLAQKQAFLAGLNSYAVEKGFRIGRGGVYGWSLHKYKDFFGCDPCSKIEWGARGPIGEDVRKFITHANIKWAKSKERKPESALSGWQND